MKKYKFSKTTRRKMSEEYIIYENFDREKPIGKVILNKKIDWEKMAITETLLTNMEKDKMVDVELDSFGIIPRVKRINFPMMDKRHKDK